MKPAYWLLKTEPSTYSFQQLLQDGKTNWSGVRNFQARNYLRQMKAGDIAVIYHSGDERAAVGVAKIKSNPYPDLDPKKKGEWVQVDLAALHALKNSIPLSAIKANPKLQTLALIKHSRLSVMPVTVEHYQELLKMGSSP